MSNIVIYMSDEHNPFYSGPYGHARVRTPNMDCLAAMGTRFESAYCPSPLCLPSRSAFMAGLPVHQVQSYNNCNAITSNYPSYGDVLRRQGVHSAYIGKVDVYNHSSTLGFTEMMMPGDRKPPGDTNFARTPLTIREGARQRANGFGPGLRPDNADARCIDRACEWLRESAPRIDTPWTLTVNTGAPHFPHRVSQELWEAYADAEDLPAHGREAASAQHPCTQDLRAHFETDHFTDEQIRGLRRGYLGRVTYVDQLLGQLLDTLEASGQLDDTVIVYTSDHGEMLGKFGLWWKSSLYEDSVRVPLIVAGPGFARGQVVKTPVSLLDLQATIFAAVGAARPAEWWGQPLQELPLDDPERAVFAEYHGHGVRSGSYMIRQGRYKLIYHMAAPHQLFDLEQDPDELNDLAQERPDVVLALTETLRGFCSPEGENERAHQVEREQRARLEA